MGPFAQGERFFESTLLRAHGTERPNGQRELLIEFQHSAQFGFRLVESANVSETDRASCSNRRLCGSVSRLTATMRLSRVSRAFHISPMPPVPRRTKIS
jgi:hypothetical protein